MGGLVEHSSRLIEEYQQSNPSPLQSTAATLTPKALTPASAMNSRKKGTRLVRHMRSHGDILIAKNSIQFSNPT
jgi:hypothetical protein